MLGGTFDPVHREHISMADGVMRELALDRLIVMPTFVPPHKVHSECAPAADRLEMCRLAFAGRRADVCGYDDLKAKCNMFHILFVDFLDPLIQIDHIEPGNIRNGRKTRIQHFVINNRAAFDIVQMIHSWCIFVNRKIR